MAFSMHGKQTGIEPHKARGKREALANADGHAKSSRTSQDLLYRCRSEGHNRSGALRVTGKERLILQNDSDFARRTLSRAEEPERVIPQTGRVDESRNRWIDTHQ